MDWNFDLGHLKKFINYLSMQILLDIFKKYLKYFMISIVIFSFINTSF